MSGLGDVSLTRGFDLCGEKLGGSSELPIPKYMKTHLCTAWALLMSLLMVPAVSAQERAASLQLAAGEHVALIGGALADRMQHSGHFEALVHAGHPGHRLVFRNLAVAGDEVVMRHRSENFGSPDQWLTRVKADVILAFFGFNESFKGRDGLAGFREDLTRFVAETRGKNYSGRGAPRLVLVSPVAAEWHRDPNYADPVPINANLAEYVRAMSEVAAASGVLFVDLFQPSQQLYAEAARAGGGEREEPQWHQRYRTIDGYNVYGGRSALAYQPGKGGFVSDRGTRPSRTSPTTRSCRRRCRSATSSPPTATAGLGGGRGRRLHVVDDSNLPPVTPWPPTSPDPTPTNPMCSSAARKPSAKMTVHSGMKVNLFADEKQFPELVNPVQMAWDTKGRLWVAVWPNYPERTPDQQDRRQLLVFEDTDGDGKADKVTTFLDDLNCPTGFQFYKDGVLVMQAPDLWFVRDTDGDGKATGRSACSWAWIPRIPITPPTPSASIPAARSTSATVCFIAPRSRPPPARCATTTVASSGSSPGPASLRPTSPTASPTRTAACSTAGATTSSPTPPATTPTSAPRSAVSSITRRSTGHEGILGTRPSRPCPGTGMLTSRHFPEEFQGNFLNMQRHQLPGHLPRQGQRGRFRPEGRDARTPDPVHRPQLPPDRHQRRGPTARSISRTGTSRSSATCSIICAIRIATRSTAASTASPTKAASC
jgi:hypothetical protein